MKTMKLAAVLLLCNIFAVGCSKQTPLYDLNEKTFIRIGYFSETIFEERYDKLVRDKFPNLSYTIVPIPVNSEPMDWENWLEHNEVDLLYVPTDRFEDAIASGAIMSLDPFIKKYNWDIDQFEPKVVEFVRSFGSGGIYGMPPLMKGKLIAFNKDLFDDNNIEYPTDNMEWDDLLQLASRFPRKGLVVQSHASSELIWNIGRDKGLKAFYKDSNLLTVTGDDWEAVWNKVANAIYSEKVIFKQGSIQSFESGEAAMALTTVSVSKFKHLDFEVDWVTSPAYRPGQDLTPYTFTEGLYAISSRSSSVEEAFALFAWLLSPAVSKLEFAENRGMPVRKQLINNIEIIEKLYEKTPVFMPNVSDYSFFELGNQALYDVMYTGQETSEILKKLEEKLESTLME